MMTPPSPPSPPTPPTPEWVKQKREKERQENRRQELIVSTTAFALDKMPTSDVTKALTLIIRNEDLVLWKRYNIAVAINNIINTVDFQSSDSKYTSVTNLKEAIFDKQTDLYKALNQQRNCGSLTIHGAMYAVSHNKSRSLQAAQAAALGGMGEREKSRYTAKL